MIRILSVVLFLLPITAVAQENACIDKIKRLTQLVEATERRGSAACLGFGIISPEGNHDGAAEEAACEARRCRAWTDARAVVTTQANKNTNCGDFISTLFASFLTTAQAYTSGCTPEAEAPTPLDCSANRQATMEALAPVMEHEPITGCFDCTALCADYRAYEAHMDSLTAGCKTKMEARMAERMPGLAALLTQTDTGCTSKGL